VGRTTGLWVLAFALFGCGDDDGDGGDGASDESCAIGVTLSGDVNQTLSANDDAACIVSFSYDSGIDAGLTTLSADLSIQVGIDAVTEGQTGSGFPTEMGVTLDNGPSYSTSPTGCSATITEHEREGTGTGELGERDYRVVGTATCTEPALREDGTAGQILLSNISYVIPAVWSD
jgi:hypothetical protein